MVMCGLLCCRAYGSGNVESSGGPQQMQKLGLKSRFFAREKSALSLAVSRGLGRAEPTLLRISESSCRRAEHKTFSSIFKDRAIKSSQDRTSAKSKLMIGSRDS